MIVFVIVFVAVIVLVSVIVFLLVRSRLLITENKRVKVKDHKCPALLFECVEWIVFIMILVWRYDDKEHLAPLSLSRPLISCTPTYSFDICLAAKERGNPGELLLLLNGGPGEPGKDVVCESWNQMKACLAYLENVILILCYSKHVSLDGEGA